MHNLGQIASIGDGERRAGRGANTPRQIARRHGKKNRREQRHAETDDPSRVITQPIVSAASAPAPQPFKRDKGQYDTGQDKEHHDRGSTWKEAQNAPPLAKWMDHDVDVIQENQKRSQASKPIER